MKKYVSESDLTHDELNAALNEESDLQFWRADIHGVLWFTRGAPMIRGVPKPAEESVEGECEFTTDDDDEFEDDE